MHTIGSRHPVLEWMGDLSREGNPLTLSDVHSRLMVTIVLFALVAGAWGIATRLRGKGISANYWGILAVGELLFIAQGTLGAYLWLSGVRPGRLGTHVLYGILVAITLPGYYSISKGRDDTTASLIYGALCFLIVALSWRAMTTGV